MRLDEQPTRESRRSAAKRALDQQRWFQCIIWETEEVCLVTVNERGQSQVSCLGQLPLWRVREFCGRHRIGLAIRTPGGEQWLAPEDVPGTVMERFVGPGGPSYWGRRRDRS